MIVNPHLQFYKEVFAIPGFLRAPILSFGFQEFDFGVTLDGNFHRDLGEYFAARGLACASMDLFDPRATLRYDMNHPVPATEYGRYGTFIDIGNVEHVFDTRQCIENSFRMIASGGHYLLHTPVNGYYGHGFHVFNPECLFGAMLENGFRVIYEKYSRMDGTIVDDPSKAGDVLAWIVARKERSFDEFVCPQQGKWKTRYTGVL